MDDLGVQGYARGAGFIVSLRVAALFFWGVQMQVLFRVEGKMSEFGGPKDKGMKPNEGLGLFSSEQDMINHGLGDFLLTKEQAGAPGLGRRLNPDKPYLACRWWETSLDREFLRSNWAYVENAKTGVRARAPRRLRASGVDKSRGRPIARLGETPEAQDERYLPRHDFR